MMKFCSYTLYYIIIAMVVVAGLCGCDKRSGRQEVFFFSSDTVTYSKLDSIFAAADKERDSMTISSSNKNNYSDDYEPSSYSSSDADRHHPGTRPDDGMFGFDPRDDLDDAYSDDHFQQDAYPNDDW